MTNQTSQNENDGQVVTEMKNIMGIDETQDDVNLDRTAQMITRESRETLIGSNKRYANQIDDYDMNNMDNMRFKSRN